MADLRDGFAAKPMPNGGYLLTTLVGDDGDAAVFGAFTSAGDMLDWISDRVGLDEDVSGFDAFWSLEDVCDAAHRSLESRIGVDAPGGVNFEDLMAVGS